MLLGISELLAKSELVPGRDYRVITVSFDETETPEDARSLKLNYIKAMNKPFPEDAWKFLTGDAQNIRKISESVGIGYKKVMHGFVHPEVLVFLSPQGKITRYFHVSTSSYGLGYPVMFSAIDFAGAVNDASKGATGSGIKQTPLLCFPHEPEQQAKFFSVLRTFGTATLILIMSLFIYLRFAKKKPSGERNKTDGE
jgi:protein SCO1/2